MKKRSFFAICVMAAAIAATMGSCKKQEAQTTTSGTPKPAAQAFDPSHIADMNAYLADFKDKALNPTRGDETMLSLEEAAWHLSSLANYDFANANVRFTDIRFDTLYCQVAVTGGQVSMADLGAAYSRAATTIDAFYHSLDLDEKHFRFIGADIDESGEVTLRVTTTYTLFEHLWYFDSYNDLHAACLTYFDPNENYYFGGNFDTQLMLAVNSIQSLSYVPIHERMYFVYTKTEEPHFLDYIDPYSPLPHYTRIFNTYDPSHPVPYHIIEYCLDSYLGLGGQLQEEHETVIEWNLLYPSGYTHVGHNHLACYYHKPSIRYGQYVFNQNHIDY